MELILIDYIFMIIYLLILIAIGYYSSRKQSDESFLISERKLGILSGIATINATKTGAILLVFTALLYLYGFSAMWYFIGVILGFTLMCLALGEAKLLFPRSCEKTGKICVRTITKIIPFFNMLVFKSMI